MTLKTQPVFYYGFEVLSEYTWVDFKEGEFGTELSFEMSVGNYTAEEIRQNLEDGFNSAGTLDYSVKFDRFTRKYVIHTNDYFELLLFSGSHADNSFLKTIGFSSHPVWGGGHLYGDPHLFYGDVDSGLFTIHGAKYPAGLKFDPQFCIQDYLDADDNEELQDASVNEAVDPREIEVIYFGEKNIYEMNFEYITNREMPCGGPIRNNPQGVEEANSFMKWGIRRKVIEFMPDKSNPSEYVIIRLEKASGGGRSGTKYKLKELVRRSLPEFYETGKLTFRRLNNVN